LAASIRKAGEILSGVDQKVRLLVISDGKETCGGNPAYEAEKLMTKYNIEPIIYVVGYNVDRNTKLQLEEIAAIGKGSYFDVKDSATLNKTINSIISKEKIKNPNFSSDGKIYKFNVNFKTDSDVVESQYVDDIQGLAAYLKANNYSAEIQGHTDSVGLQEYNRKLSAYRAKSVLEKLVDMGVDRNKLTSAGYGDSKPLVSNSTEEGKFKNRRVEAHIVK
jgi:outer membrane protein OmpA-like peptidoglycan-associated protein